MFFSTLNEGTDNECKGNAGTKPNEMATNIDGTLSDANLVKQFDDICPICSTQLEDAIQLAYADPKNAVIVEHEGNFYIQNDELHQFMEAAGYDDERIAINAIIEAYEDDAPEMTCENVVIVFPVDEEALMEAKSDGEDKSEKTKDEINDVKEKGIKAALARRKAKKAEKKEAKRQAKEDAINCRESMIEMLVSEGAIRNLFSGLNSQIKKKVGETQTKNAIKNIPNFEKARKLIDSFMNNATTVKDINIVISDLSIGIPILERAIDKADYAEQKAALMDQLKYCKAALKKAEAKKAKIEKGA